MNGKVAALTTIFLRESLAMSVFGAEQRHSVSEIPSTYDNLQHL
jgi:hypothetical protein